MFTQRSRDAITVTRKTRHNHFRHFTSEQNKVSKSDLLWAFFETQCIMRFQLFGLVQ